VLHEGGTTIPVTPVRVSAPAKVNLALSVGRRRTDGYHDVTTVLQALELLDTLTFEHAEGLEVVYRPDIGVSGDRDLVRAAALALAEESGCAPNAAITVDKRIPIGAGLGGGSSDAAAALAGLAALWSLELGEDELRGIAGGLGSDVPFFVSGGCALFEGRGDTLARKLPVVPMDVVLVKPDPPVPTGEAYALLDARSRTGAEVEPTLDAIGSGSRSAVASALANDLAEAARTLVSEVGDALAFVCGSEGILGAEVAGSGSSVFGICETREAAETCAGTARERGWWARSTSASPIGVRVQSEA
jgi:4-diphosphocytidyl-2-C-methyl-D-erythritol kinase